MYVEASVWRQIENRFGQDASVGYNHNDLGIPSHQSFKKLGVADLFRSDNRNAVTFSNSSHRRWNTPLAPAGRTVRLGDDTGYGIGAQDQLLQCDSGNLRSSHKDNGPRGRHEK